MRSVSFAYLNSLGAGYPFEMRMLPVPTTLDIFVFVRLTGSMGDPKVSSVLLFDLSPVYVPVSPPITSSTFGCDAGLSKLLW